MLVEEVLAELARAAREAGDADELGEILLQAVVLRRIVEMGWYRVCRAAVEGRPRGFVREAARQAGLGHQNVIRWADWARDDFDPLFSLRAARRCP